MDRSKKTYSAEEALDEVFKLLENDTANKLNDDENGDFEELGQDMYFEKEEMEPFEVDEVDLVGTESKQNITMQLASM